MIETPSVTQQIKDLREQISQSERKLAQDKGELQYLEQKHLDGLVIKWREEVRSCSKNDKGEPIFTTIELVTNCVEMKNSITANRKIKNMLSTTLSALHNEGEMGRIACNDIVYYGFKELFIEGDLTKVKEEYMERFKGCRQFAENFINEH